MNDYTLVSFYLQQAPHTDCFRPEDMLRKEKLSLLHDPPTLPWLRALLAVAYNFIFRESQMRSWRNWQTH
jgi:hypothetical protein